MIPLIKFIIPATLIPIFLYCFNEKKVIAYLSIRRLLSGLWVSLRDFFQLMFIIYNRCSIVICKYLLYTYRRYSLESKKLFKVQFSKFLLIFFLFFVLCIQCISAKKVPAWFDNRESVYPQSKYISAGGEGYSPEEARNDALKQISLFFDSQVSVDSELVQEYSEIEVNEFYKSASSKQVAEKVKIDSVSDFFCVEFTETLKVKKTYYVCAFIDKNKFRESSISGIKTNVSIIESLLELAQLKGNAFYSVPACRKGYILANVTANMIRNVSKVCDDVPNFAEELEVVEEMLEVYRNSLDNICFYIETFGDSKSLVYSKVSQLLEGQGYVVAKNTGSSDGLQSYSPLKIRIDFSPTVTQAYVLEKCSLIVSAQNERGRTVFSYTRSFEIKDRFENMAEERIYSLIIDELEKTFVDEFNRGLSL